MSDKKTIGGIQRFAINGQAIPGTFGITVDVPNGPTHQSDMWILDSASLIYTTNSEVTTSECIDGLFVVPVGTNPISDQVGILDVNGRGIPLPPMDPPPFVSDNFPNVYLALVFAGRSRIIPYGYTLRGYMGCPPGGTPPQGTMLLEAIIRVVDVSCLC